MESALDQGSNPCALHLQADSSPLDHRANLVTQLLTSFSVAWLSARRCHQADNSERALKDSGGQGLPATRTDGALGFTGQVLGKRPDRRFQKDSVSLLKEGVSLHQWLDKACCSIVQSCPTLCQASLSITNSWSLLKPMSIESVMPSNHLILCHPLLLPPSISPSIRVFSSGSVLCSRWPEHWSFSFNISPSDEYSRLISFRMDWLDPLPSKGLSRVLTLKSTFFKKPR